MCAHPLQLTVKLHNDTANMLSTSAQFQIRQRFPSPISIRRAQKRRVGKKDLEKKRKLIEKCKITTNPGLFINFSEMTSLWGDDFHADVVKPYVASIER